MPSSTSCFSLRERTFRFTDLVVILFKIKSKTDFLFLRKVILCLLFQSNQPIPVRLEFLTFSRAKMVQFSLISGVCVPTGSGKVVTIAEVLLHPILLHPGYLTHKPPFDRPGNTGSRYYVRGSTVSDVTTCGVHCILFPHDNINSNGAYYGRMNCFHRRLKMEMIEM